jgi:ribonucleoside-diphosphate reductase alpha chain
MDRLTLAISQGSLRRGSAAVYLDITHPEIEEFLEIRKASGDFNRKGLNLHHGINITDEFMDCVKEGKMFGLRSPKDQQVLREVNARELWQRILETRLQTGEPYILNIDAVNRALPKHQRELGLKVNTSNLCSEITLPTGADHDGKERTAVCCLSSLNIETWDQWAEDEGFVEDVLRMLDNVLTSFIEEAPDSMHRAKYSALRERSVGLGVMGFHSFLQSKNIPLESAMAKSWNLRIFKKIRREADAASYHLAEERGACEDARERRYESPLQPQDRHRPDRLDLDHLRRHQRLGRADPGQCLHPQDAVGRLLGAQPPICRSCWIEKGQDTDEVWSVDRRAGRAACSTWTS